MGRLHAGKKSRLKVYVYRDAVTRSFMDYDSLSMVQREKEKERERIQVSGCARRINSISTSMG